MRRSLKSRIKQVPVRAAAVLPLVLFVAGVTAAGADAHIYEGPPAAVAYHEANTAYTGLLHTAEYDDQLWEFYPQTPPASGASTSPSVSLACYTCAEEGAYDAAVNATSGTVWTRVWYGEDAWHNTGLGYATHTSPAISSFWFAFNASSSGHLWIRNAVSGGGPGDTGLGMAAETSPSIANGATKYHAAFHASGTNHLWIYEEGGTAWDTGLGMATGTSPAITKAGYVAFIASGTNHLWVYNIATRTAVDTGATAGTGSSPSVIDWGGYLVAFQASSGHLGLYQSGSSGWIDTGHAMQPTSSPSIAKRCFATECHWDVLYQAASTHHLWNYSETAGAYDAGPVLGEHSSPSISGGE